MTYITESAGLPFRLGRHVNHDPRSRAYRFQPRRRTLMPKRWARNVGVFDQGDLGSCTGNAAAGWIATANMDRDGLRVLTDGRQIDEALAVAIYSRATSLDPFDGAWPPEDTGSDGLSVTKVLVELGVVDVYQHGFSLQDALAALQEGPVLWGTNWYWEMFDPDPAGHITIGGVLAGGHEILLDEIDVERQRVWFTNSWGAGWGLYGRAWLTWADLDRLLNEDGDITVPHSKIVVGPEPEPTPEPIPEPVPVPEKPGCMPKSMARLFRRKR